MRAPTATLYRTMSRHDNHLAGAAITTQSALVNVCTCNRMALSTSADAPSLHSCTAHRLRAARQIRASPSISSHPTMPDAQSGTACWINSTLIRPLGKRSIQIPRPANRTPEQAAIDRCCDIRNAASTQMISKRLGAAVPTRFLRISRYSLRNIVVRTLKRYRRTRQRITTWPEHPFRRNRPFMKPANGWNPSEWVSESHLIHTA